MLIALVGPLPPPIHGQAVATAAMAKLLESNGATLIKVDTGGEGVGAWPRRIAQHCRAVWVLHSSRLDHLYLSVNANRGMWLTLLVVVAARLAGIPLTLHHHSRGYIDRKRTAVAALCWIAGRRALHLVQGKSLADAFQTTYARARRVIAFSNAAAVSPITCHAKEAGSLVLGHLGNLCCQKGIVTVARTFEATVAAHPDTYLIIGGPCCDATARDTLAVLLAEHPGRVEYVGPLGEAGKREFFNRVDVFLFPSSYSVETQGIVNLEALAAGVPVIAYGLGCIADDIGDSGGIVIDRTSDFVSSALEYLSAYRRDRYTARARAHRRFLELHTEAQDQVSTLLREIELKPSHHYGTTRKLSTNSTSPLPVDLRTLKPTV